MGKEAVTVAISIKCMACQKVHKLDTKECPECGSNLKLTQNRKFKVRVRVPSTGRWLTKQVDQFQLAKNVEAKFKTQSIESQLFNKMPVPTIAVVWRKYLAWAKVHKRSWSDDYQRWTKHALPYLNPEMKLDKLTPQRVQRILDQMTNSEDRQYAPATIKRVYETIRRVINWSIKNRLYYGLNPCNSVEPPKFDNRVTNVLTKAHIRHLMVYLDSYSNERTALVIKYALWSGRRRGEILSLTWDNTAHSRFIPGIVWQGGHAHPQGTVGTP